MSSCLWSVSGQPRQASPDVHVFLSILLSYLHEKTSFVHREPCPSVAGEPMAVCCACRYSAGLRRLPCFGSRGGDTRQWEHRPRRRLVRALVGRAPYAVRYRLLRDSLVCGQLGGGNPGGGCRSHLPVEPQTTGSPDTGVGLCRIRTGRLLWQGWFWTSTSPGDSLCRDRVGWQLPFRPREHLGSSLRAGLLPAVPRHALTTPQETVAGPGISLPSADRVQSPVPRRALPVGRPRGMGCRAVVVHSHPGRARLCPSAERYETSGDGLQVAAEHCEVDCASRPEGRGGEEVHSRSPVPQPGGAKCGDRDNEVAQEIVRPKRRRLGVLWSKVHDQRLPRRLTIFLEPTQDEGAAQSRE